MDAATRFVRPPTEPARLTSAQKRDLLGIAASALVTTALIAAPMFIADAPAPTVMAARVDTTLPATTIESAPASVALPAPAKVDVAPAAPVQRRRASSLARAWTRTDADTQIQPAAYVSPAPHDMKPQRKAFGRRLTGLFTGDGTYSVRPFPTVATERQ